jgi:hypothetical protein
MEELRHDEVVYHVFPILKVVQSVWISVVNV